jgi:hypothetical protein
MWPTHKLRRAQSKHSEVIPAIVHRCETDGILSRGNNGNSKRCAAGRIYRELADEFAVLREFHDLVIQRLSRRGLTDGASPLLVSKCPLGANTKPSGHGRTKTAFKTEPAPMEVNSRPRLHGLRRSSLSPRTGISAGITEIKNANSMFRASTT